MSKERAKSKEYSCPVEVRFSDLDAYGHVNSAVYFTYLETARLKLFSDGFQEISRQGILLVVGRAECDYLAPIMLYDKVVVGVTFARMGRSSFDLEYRLHDGGDKCYAKARTTMVCFDPVHKTAVPVPDVLKSMA